jgi:hypothetical protein
MAMEEQIRELAYFIWENEGRPEGKDQEHYFRAERMLTEQEAVRGTAPNAPAESAPGAEFNIERAEAGSLSVEEHLNAIKRVIEKERQTSSSKTESRKKSKA